MRDKLVFFGQIARRWRVTGAVAPSGPVLARAMADAVGDVPDGHVLLELGPGTGVFSRELVRRFPRARVVAVEVNEVFATRLAATVPELTVVRGCASRLDAHLAKLGVTPDRVAAVVSGLPLLVLPGDLPSRVLAAIAGTLRPGRRYVQFTYSARAWRRFTVNGFRPLPDRRVWLNFPPAIVLPFERDDHALPPGGLASSLSAGPVAPIQ